MEALFDFLLKASAGIALFYALFWILLRNETFYNANRLFLLCVLLTSILLPLFPVHYTVLVENPNNQTVFHALSETFRNAHPAELGTQIQQPTFSWQQATLMIYLTGAALFLIRLVAQIISLIFLILKSKIKKIEGIRIVENEKYGLPFSFFNVVFINPKFHKQENLPEILAHEKVHIRENHWFDLLLIELLTVIFWFNPFIWLFEHAIKQNHEYLADKGVLAQGHQMGRYQALLVNQLMGMQIIGVTNNLNFALNTNRLKMMTKKKTSRVLGIKFIWTLPVLALLIIMCSEPSVQMKEDETINSELELKQGEKELFLSGVVIDEQTGEPAPGTSILVKGTTIGTVSDKQGKFSLPASANDKVIFSYVGKETVVKNAKELEENTEVKMKDGVIHISVTDKTEEQLSPPPPPKGETLPSQLGKNEKEKVVPAQPPKSAKKDEPIFFVVEELPKYPGGHAALNEYVNILCEKYAVENNVEGKIRVGFTVDDDGKVTDIKLLPIFVIHPEKNQENVKKITSYGNQDAQDAAVAIVSNMKDWKPGSQRGKPVPVNYAMTIEF